MVKKEQPKKIEPTPLRHSQPLLNPPMNPALSLPDHRNQLSSSPAPSTLTNPRHTFQSSSSLACPQHLTFQQTWPRPAFKSTSFSWPLCLQITMELYWFSFLPSSLATPSQTPLQTPLLCSNWMMMRPNAQCQALSVLYSFPGTPFRPHNFTFQLDADDIPLWHFLKLHSLPYSCTHHLLSGT